MDRAINYIFTPIQEELLCFHKTTDTELINPALPYHRHDAYEIYLFLRGNAYMYLEQSCYKLAPGEMHHCICIDNQMYERIGLNIKKSALERLSSGRSNLLACFESHPLGQNNLTRLSLEQTVLYCRLADQLIACLGSDAYGQDLLAESYATRLLVFINTLYQSSTCSSNNLMPELVSNTMTYIKEHLAEAISSEQLEHEFHYSGKYISRLFREHT